jgi:hypothetical protein
MQINTLIDLAVKSIKVMPPSQAESICFHAIPPTVILSEAKNPRS